MDRTRRSHRRHTRNGHPMTADQWVAVCLFIIGPTWTALSIHRHYKDQ